MATEVWRWQVRLYLVIDFSQALVVFFVIAVEVIHVRGVAVVIGCHGEVRLVDVVLASS